MSERRFLLHKGQQNGAESESAHQRRAERLQEILNKLTVFDSPQEGVTFMAKRILRVIKWLRQTPVMAVCEACGQQFKAPMTALAKTKDAQASLQRQFDFPKRTPGTS